VAVAGAVLGLGLDVRHARRTRRATARRAGLAAGVVRAARPALEQAREVVSQAAEAARPRVEQLVEAATPKVVQLAETTREAAQQAAEAARPRVEQLATRAAEGTKRTAELARERAAASLDHRLSSNHRPRRAADASRRRLVSARS
jgi:hypothetical protein